MSEKIQNNIREHRKKSGMTQEALAEALGVSRQTIISIEKEKYIPSLPLALKIARFFNCSTNDMFVLKED